MELEKLKSKLYYLIEDDRLKQSFDLLRKEVNEKSDHLFMLISLKSRFKEHMSERMFRVINYKKSKIEKSRIREDLMEFISYLKQEDLGAEIIYKNEEITNKILVLTQKEKVGEVRDFFLQLNFINVEARAYNENEDSFDKYEIVVFDNQDLPFCNSEKMLDSFDQGIQDIVKSRIKKMEAIVALDHKFVIHFGEYLYWINSNRNRVHPANSQFSLHARTKEVVEFINTYLN